MLLDLKRRGLKHDPELAIGDGALRFWKALPQVFGSTREQWAATIILSGRKK